MNRLLTGAVTAAGSLALVGGAIAAAAGPAAAGPSGGNSAYGSSSTGVISSPPQAVATSNGVNSVTARNVNISGLLTTGLTQDFSSTTTTFSRVNTVRASDSVRGNNATLTANEISSTCRPGAAVGGPSNFNAPVSSEGSAAIVNGVLNVSGTITNLPQHPTRNETFTVPGFGSIVMNQQLPAAGGGVEVIGVHVRVSGDPGEDLYLAVSVCNSPGERSNTVTVADVENQTSNSGTPITPLHITATDSDPGQSLTFSASGLPPGLSINHTTGFITGTPTTGKATPYPVTVTATDTTGASGSETFDWTINNVVSVTNPGTQAIAVGTAVDLPITATDSDLGQVLTFSATGLPPGLSINTSTGAISGTPTTAIGSPFSVMVTATDTAGFTSSATFSFTVTSPNVVTVSPSAIALNAIVGDPVTTVTMTTTDTGVVTPFTPFTYAIASGSLPSGVSLNTSTGAISGTPAVGSDAGSPYHVTVRATDTTGASGVTGTITINVAVGP
jgi:putative Ig domain-containing protein